MNTILLSYAFGFLIASGILAWTNHKRTDLCLSEKLVAYVFIAGLWPLMAACIITGVVAGVVGHLADMLESFE